MLVSSHHCHHGRRHERIVPDQGKHAKDQSKQQRDQPDFEQHNKAANHRCSLLLKPWMSGVLVEIVTFVI